MAKVIRSSKEIVGIEMKVGDEFDAGYIPAGSAYRRCRVTVRKDAPDRWSVYAISFLGGEKLTAWDILAFQCETCAKAFALCVVYGDKYAGCHIHEQDGFSDADTYAARVAVLCCLFGLSKADYATLPRGAMDRLAWIARLVSDGQLTWERVLRAIEVAEQLRSKRSLSIEGTISTFYSEATKIIVYR